MRPEITHEEKVVEEHERENDLLVEFFSVLDVGMVME